MLHFSFAWFTSINQLRLDYIYIYTHTHTHTHTKQEVWINEQWVCYCGFA